MTMFFFPSATVVTKFPGELPQRGCQIHLGVGKIAIFDEITIYLGNGYYGTLTISRRQLNDE